MSKGIRREIISLKIDHENDFREFRETLNILYSELSMFFSMNELYQHIETNNMFLH